MVRHISKIAIASLCLLALAVFTPQAKANTVDFGCGASLGACTGTLMTNGTLAVTGTGIGVLSSFDGSEVFGVNFSTNSAGVGTISIGDNDGDNVSGNILSVTPVSNGVELDVQWTSLSPNIVTALGGTMGVGGSFVLTVSTNAGTNNVLSADFTVLPTPEPASLLLLGTGLLGLGGVARRRWLN